MTAVSHLIISSLIQWLYNSSIIIALIFPIWKPHAQQINLPSAPQCPLRKRKSCDWIVQRENCIVDINEFPAALNQKQIFYQFAESANNHPPGRNQSTSRKSVVVHAYTCGFVRRCARCHSLRRLAKPSCRCIWRSPPWTDRSGLVPDNALINRKELSQLPRTPSK